MTYFAFQADLRAVPAVPTHCRGPGCAEPLEPMRRYAGLCKRCVARRVLPLSVASTPAPGESTLVVVAEFTKRNSSGHRERYVQVKCTCGSRRMLKAATWTHQRPACCNKCRLRQVEARGFEAEFAR
jgi:hypothetical protein